MSLQIAEWTDPAESPAEKGLPASAPEESAMTVGVFDGVHLGHQELIRRIVMQGPNPTIVTFRENPKKCVSPEHFEGDLFSLKQKLAVFERLGVSRVILIDFSENFSKLRGWEFLDLLENRGKMVFLAIGSNFRCGYQQDTNADLIKEKNRRKGIPTEVVEPVIVAAGLVSSSRIRSAILSGNLKQAAVLMGRNVELDLSDLRPEGQVYDFNSVHRIVPAEGKYPVLIYPGRKAGWAITENGKVYLSGGTVGPPESLEFIVN